MQQCLDDINATYQRYLGGFGEHLNDNVYLKQFLYSSTCPPRLRCRLPLCAGGVNHIRRALTDDIINRPILGVQLRRRRFKHVDGGELEKCPVPKPIAQRVPRPEM